MPQGILSLAQSMTYNLSGENYSTLDASRIASRIDRGFASAANIRNDTDILAIQAAMRINERSGKGSDLIEAKKTLEAGFINNPELLKEWLDGIGDFSRASKINLASQQFGLNTTQSEQIVDNFEVSEMGALELSAKLKRFGNEEKVANVAIAMHQASGQSNATADESIQAMLQNYSHLQAQGIAGNATDMAQGILSLSQSMTYNLSGKNYSTLDASRIANRIDRGFASAARMQNDSDILAMQAAMRINERSGKGSDLIEAKKTLEAGFSNNPELLKEWLEGNRRFGREARINLVKQQFGLNTTQAEQLVDNFEVSDDITPESIDKIKNTEANLNPQ